MTEVGEVHISYNIFNRALIEQGTNLKGWPLSHAYPYNPLNIYYDYGYHYYYYDDDDDDYE